MNGIVAHVVGARPNFPKMAPVFRALRENGVQQRLVHTGQHSDPAMSDVFFRDLELPQPDVNLGVRAAGHAEQTARTMLALDDYLTTQPLGAVVVYGDVNSTVAAALVAVKRGLPVVHVESGLRSRDRAMPEEINRLAVDAVADLLLATSADAVENLLAEGHDEATVRFVGNTMIDSMFRVRHLLADRFRSMKVDGEFALATFHRPSNVDALEDLGRVVRALEQVGDRLPVLMPVHPRSRAAFESYRASVVSNVTFMPPLGYVDFLALLAHCRVVLTDSGGVQEECTALKVPCLTFRTSTERPVTIELGTNMLVSTATLQSGLERALRGALTQSSQMPPLWDGQAGPRAAAAIQKLLGGK